MDAQATHEADRETIVHQQKEVAVRPGIALHPRENIEKAIAAGRVLVKCPHHAVARPNAIGAPRGGEDDVVDCRTENVVGDARAIRRRAAFRRLTLEALHFVDRRGAQRVKVRRGCDTAQAADQIEDR